MTGLVVVLIVVTALIILVFTRGTGRNRRDRNGNPVRLNYFERSEPINRAERRRRDRAAG